jgi:hypothetical protein
MSLSLTASRIDYMIKVMKKMFLIVTTRKMEKKNGFCRMKNFQLKIKHQITQNNVLMDVKM